MSSIGAVVVAEQEASNTLTGKKQAAHRRGVFMAGIIPVVEQKRRQ
jgi:hypothetical protein